MRTKLVLEGLLAFVFALSAQCQFTNGSGSDIYKTLLSGNTGIGNSSPTQKLHISTGFANDGIKVTQTTTGGSALSLQNLSTGGRHWALISYGAGNSQGSGNFGIYDYSNSTNPFFIEGGTGNVGIGTLSPNLAKLYVNNDAAPGGTTQWGTRSIITQVSPLQGSQFLPYIGIEGRASTNYSGENRMYGVVGSGANGLENYGGCFSATGGINAGSNYGIYAEANGNSNNYGIYATVFGSPNNGGAGPNWAGYFDGDIVTAQGSYLYSDKRIKKDINKINNSLEIISKLNPVSYHFNSEANPEITLPQEKQYGFISQEIQEILPEFTKVAINPARLDKEGKELYPSKEILSLNYNGFIALLTKGMQEQQVQITLQNQEIAGLKNEVAGLKKVANTTAINETNDGVSGFTMSQNEPNPFTHETVVKYTLPQSVSNAFMAVYDLTGKQITTFPIEQKGSSSLIITSEKLAAGIYIYSIVADGKIIDSKRMIVAEK